MKELPEKQLQRDHELMLIYRPFSIYFKVKFLKCIFIFETILKFQFNIILNLVYIAVLVDEL